MKKNLLKIYESFFDDLDKLNKDKEDNEFSDLNNEIYDEHDFILSQDKNPEFFYALCNMCDLCKKENIFHKRFYDKAIILFLI